MSHNQDSLPRIVLRIPGPWERMRALKERLPRGFGVEGERLLIPGGRALLLDRMPADPLFPGVFNMACRRRPLKPTEVRALNAYKMNAAVVGPGGSMKAAQGLLEAGAGLIRAGGVGVFIDNSAVAHSGSDWLELAEYHTDPEAVFYAFVNLARSGNRIASHGMHVIGQRDAVVNTEADLPTLEDFLRMVFVSMRSLNEGETFVDKRDRCFRLHGEPDDSWHGDHPIYNPYGRWRLEPVQPGRQASGGPMKI